MSNTNLLDRLNPNLLNEKNLNSLNKQFLSAKPFPHIQIKNFIKEEKAITILEALKKEKFIEKESDLFQFKQTNDLYFSKNKELKKFNSSLLSWDFFSLIEKITSSKFKGTLDMSATLYENTDFLLPHDDEIEGRKIAYLLYLSENFTEKDGGLFILYNSKNNAPTSISKKFVPHFNSLLLFEVSKKSFHQVREILSHKKRFSITGWFYG